MIELTPGVVRRDIEIRGGPLAALEAGTAERGTVLLVPGFTGSKEDFRFVLPLLAEAGWRAVSIDQRGQYQSPGPDDPAAYSVSALGRDVLAVAVALGPLHLVGHSFGGLVTRSAVLQDPGAVRSHLLMDSGPAALTGPRAEVMTLLRPVIEQGGLPAVWDAMEAISANEPRRVQVVVDLKDFQRARLVGGSPVGLLAMGEALLSEPDRVAELRSAGVRTLVLYGEGDDAWLPLLQDQMADRLGAQVVVVEGALHSPAAEQPEATAAALVEWFSRH